MVFQVHSHSRKSSLLLSLRGLKKSCFFVDGSRVLSNDGQSVICRHSRLEVRPADLGQDAARSFSAPSPVCSALAWSPSAHVQPGWSPSEPARVSLSAGTAYKYSEWPRASEAPPVPSSGHPLPVTPLPSAFSVPDLALLLPKSFTCLSLSEEDSLQRFMHTQGHGGFICICSSVDF